MTKLGITKSPYMTFYGDGSDAPRAVVLLKDGKIVYEGDLPVDDAVKLLFDSHWGAIMREAALHQATRDAFKAGWRTNAVTETPENAEYLFGCEQTDFNEFQRLGLDAYLTLIHESDKEVAAEEAEAQEAIKDDGIYVSDEEPLPDDFFEKATPTKPGEDLIPVIKLPADFNAGTLVTLGPSGITFNEVKPFTKLVFGPCSLNLDTGELDIPESIKLDEAAWRFWSAVRTHILQDKNPTLVKHKVRGTTYEVLGLAEGQISVPNVASKYGAGSLVFEGTRLMVYRGEDGKLWWRFPDEFGDGRFEAL